MKTISHQIFYFPLIFVKIIKVGIKYLKKKKKISRINNKYLKIIFIQVELIVLLFFNLIK